MEAILLKCSNFYKATHEVSMATLGFLRPYLEAVVQGLLADWHVYNGI